MISNSMIGLLSKLLDDYFSRGSIVSILMSAGVPGNEPRKRDGQELNKAQLITEWLRRVNQENAGASSVVLGGILRSLLENDSRRRNDLGPSERAELEARLAESGLRYLNGGTLLPVLMTGGATPTLEELLRTHKFPAVLEEFNRATGNVQTDPRQAVLAAATILEAVCREYVVLHPALTMPNDQSLIPLYKVVRDNLGLDSATAADNDLKRTLGGLATVVDGIAALRTHASAAHAQRTSASQYVLSPPKARLAVQAAHTVVTFIIETWEECDPRPCR